MKTCKKCKLEKIDSEYHKDKKNKDGFCSVCKMCKSDYDKTLRERNPEHYKNLRQSLVYREYEKNRRNSIERKKYMQMYKKGDKWKNYQKKYRKNYQKKYQKKYISKPRKETYYREYYQSHKEKMRFAGKKGNHKRNSRMKGLLHDFSASDWEICKEYFKNCCAYCEKQTENLAQEHFFPVMLNGGYTKSNIVPACKSCNSQKGISHPKHWIIKKGYGVKKYDEIIKFLKMRLTQPSPNAKDCIDRLFVLK